MRIKNLLRKIKKLETKLSKEKYYAQIPVKILRIKVLAAYHRV